MKPEPTPLFCSDLAVVRRVAAAALALVAAIAAAIVAATAAHRRRAAAGRGIGMPKKRRKNSDMSPSSMPGGRPRRSLLDHARVVRIFTTDGPHLVDERREIRQVHRRRRDAICDTNGRHTASAAAAMNLRSEKVAHMLEAGSWITWKACILW